MVGLGNKRLKIQNSGQITRAEYLQQKYFHSGVNFVCKPLSQKLFILAAEEQSKKAQLVVSGII